MAECESTRGRWGQRCPDCGQTLPVLPGPLQSEHSKRGRPLAFASGSSAGLGERQQSNRHRFTPRAPVPEASKFRLERSRPLKEVQP